MAAMDLLPLLFLAAGTTARAGTLTYEEALQRALDGNAELLKAAEGQRSADGALLAARATFEPTLTASGSWLSSRGESTQQYGDVFSDFQSLSWDAAVSQTLFTGTNLSLSTSGSQSRFRYELPDTGFVVESEDPEFSTELQARVSQNLLQGLSPSYNEQAVRTARRARTSAELQVEQTRQQTLADTANLYWSLYYAQELVRIAEQSLAVAEEERRVVLAKVEAGELAPVEATRVEAAVVQARSSLIEARNGRDAAAEALQLMVGEEADGDVTAVTPPAEPTPVDLDLDALVRDALDHNPGLQLLRLQEEGAAADLRDARHARLPQLSATGALTLKGYETALGDSYRELFGGSLRDWYLGADLTLPLGNRADRGAVIQGQATLAQARIDREAYERSLVQQVRNQVRQVEQDSVKLELAQANLRLAEQTLAAERALQEAGRALQKDVLEAIKAVDDARVAVERARGDHAVAVVELMRLRGAL